MELLVADVLLAAEHDVVLVVQQVQGLVESCYYLQLLQILQLDKLLLDYNA